MLVTIDIKENELLDAADEMIKAADELSKKAWRLKSIVMAEEKKNQPKAG